MEFAATLNNGQEVTIEVYYDDQPGVEAGWCWRGKGADARYAGGDILNSDTAEEALSEAKNVWGVRA